MPGEVAGDNCRRVRPRLKLLAPPWVGHPPSAAVAKLDATLCVGTCRSPAAVAGQWQQGVAGGGLQPRWQGAKLQRSCPFSLPVCWPGAAQPRPQLLPRGLSADAADGFMYKAADRIKMMLSHVREAAAKRRHPPCRALASQGAALPIALPCLTSPPGLIGGPGTARVAAPRPRPSLSPGATPDIGNPCWPCGRLTAIARRHPTQLLRAEAGSLSGQAPASLRASPVGGTLGHHRTAGVHHVR